MERNLVFKGYDSHCRPVYEDAECRLFVDLDPRPNTAVRLCTKLNNEFDGEPDTPIQYTKYKGDTFTFDHQAKWGN